MKHFNEEAFSTRESSDMTHWKNAIVLNYLLPVAG